MTIDIRGDALCFLKDFARHANGFFSKEIAGAMWYDLDEFRRRAHLLDLALQGNAQKSKKTPQERSGNS